MLVDVKRTGRWISNDQAIADSAVYWQRQPIARRIEAVELARRITPGVYGAAAARMERVYQLAVASSGQVLAEGLAVLPRDKQRRR
jgi:hypothetical protein